MVRTIARHPLARRLVETVLTLFGVAVLVFVTLRAIPGDQITATLGTEAAALTPEQQASLRAYYGLDKPLVVQFFSWLGNLFTGNLGYSRRAGDSVLAMTGSALPVTIELAVLATIIGLVIGVPLALLSASRPNAVRDGFGQLVGLLALSVPNFLIGATLLTLVSKYAHYNPNAQGFAHLFEDPGLNLQQMLFPALVLGFGLAAPIMRTARSALLEVQTQDFVRTARGKGVAPLRLRVRHVLHNALNPIVTMTGIQFGYLLGGAVVVEQIFSVPGIGRQVLVGMQQKEYAVVQSTVLVIAATFVLVNLLTDLLYRVLDPRVRAS
ncbi:ABC transporter permease [Dactylosporangium darangshiense]|uniref:ABC transporter permease n=1 Tax=Dactylosporangium darangshiense TaxID=579108 RepID=A0ABP8DFL7_9ACTN